MSRIRNTSGMIVNKSRCKTCMFNEGGCLRTRASVEKRVLTQASQICHHTDKTLCKGARDFQIQIFHRLGILSEPTQEAWDETMKTMQNKPV